MILDLIRLDHLHCLVEVGIEHLAGCRNRLYSESCQRVMKLLVDQLDARAKVFNRCSISLQSAVEAVHDGQQRLQGLGKRVIAKILLIARAAFAKVVELSLQASQPFKVACLLGPECF